MTLLDRLKAFFEGADAPTETDSPRDGVLSYSGEWHALEVGLFGGFAVGYTGDVELTLAFAAIVFGGRKLGNAHLQDARKEAGYTGLSFVVGALLGLGAGLAT